MAVPARSDTSSADTVVELSGVWKIFHQKLRTEKLSEEEPDIYRRARWFLRSRRLSYHLMVLQIKRRVMGNLPGLSMEKMQEKQLIELTGTL